MIFSFFAIIAQQYRFVNILSHLSFSPQHSSNSRSPPIEFDEKLWRAVVDRVTVYSDDRPVYSLKDGSEITVML